tara:strand:+ start:1064 stop:1198 length:135 start_codon:yes stop_codon:yes gene_type:complete
MRTTYLGQAGGQSADASDCVLWFDWVEIADKTEVNIRWDLDDEK